MTTKMFINHMNRCFVQNLKKQSTTNSTTTSSRFIVRLCTGNLFEYVTTTRYLLRSPKLLNYYEKLLDRTVKDLFHRLRRQFQRRATKGIMLSSVGLVSFNWDTGRLGYDAAKQHLDELEFIRKLQKETIICSVCNKRIQIDCKLDGIDYCMCPKDVTNKRKNVFNDSNQKKRRWLPYLERKNMIIWRKEEQNGLYAYKVYASYPDITAEDFLFVQTDIEYRKQWDKTAVKLEVVDTDPVHLRKSQIIYWEMLWPKFFSNREYVFNRRYFIDRSRKLIVILSKSIEHPNCPITNNCHRVKEYWSQMVIKPLDTFKKPGLEYVLTYFDNPGVVLPPPITAWVAQKQMPDFLNKLYCATLEYAQRRKTEIKVFHHWDRLRDPGFEYPPEPQPDFLKDENNDEDNVDYDCGDNGGTCTSDHINQQNDKAEDIDAIPADDTVNNKPKRWWHYIFTVLSDSSNNNNTNTNNSSQTKLG